MTKPVKKWPGELGKPIRRLPIDMMTHGGQIIEKTADVYNADASATIDKALDKVRRIKIPLLAQYYGVGPQNYDETPPQFHSAQILPANLFSRFFQLLELKQ